MAWSHQTFIGMEGDKLVLLSLLGIGLGLYGATQIAREPVQYCREQYFKKERGNSDIDIICQYMNIQQKDGVYPSHYFDDIEKTMRRHFYFRDDDISKLKKQFEYKIKQQKKTRMEKINNEYHIKKQEYCSRIRNNYKEDYFEVHHWHTLPKEKHQQRINNIYQQTFWKDIAIEPPYLMKNDNNCGYIEVWHIKKPTGYCNIQKYYDIVIKKMGYEYV